MNNMFKHLHHLIQFIPLKQISTHFFSNNLNNLLYSMETSYHPFLLWKWKDLLYWFRRILLKYLHLMEGFFFQILKGLHLLAGLPFYWRISFWKIYYLWKDFLLMQLEGFPSCAIGRISLLCNWKDFPLMQLEGFPSYAIERISLLWKDFLLMERFP